MKALRLPVLENKSFKVDLLRSYVLTCDPYGGTFLTPWHHTKKRDKGPLLDATHAKYQSSRPSSFKEKDF